MLGAGFLAFAQPWLLMGLLALPALWWLLRLVPPPPREVDFPPVRFLLLLTGRETTARRTPWWLVLLRITAIACLILATSRPLLNPAEGLPGDGPLLVVVDDGWAAAPHWDAMVEAAGTAIGQAEREGREVVLVTTAPTVDTPVVEPMLAAVAGERMVALEPQPWWPDRRAAGRAIANAALDRASVLWLTDGLVRDGAGRAEARALVAQLESLGPLEILAPEEPDRATLLAPVAVPDGSLAVAVHRPFEVGRPTELVRALAVAGDVLGRQQVDFEPMMRAATARFDLPAPVAERVRRFERLPTNSAGDVVLADQGLGARTVGIVAAGGLGEAQPLLSERFFVERALAGRAQLVTGPVETVLDADVAAIVLLDDQELSVGQEAALESWVADGGVLLRFAGPNLAERVDDPLVPVRLRAGGRLLDGALSWSQPLALGGFAATGPLAGLPVSEDARIRRQVLAEPSPELAAATLAVLSDGTPFVTGRNEGNGWLMLVHTTANTQWSDIALSGTFVALLERAADMGRGRTPAVGDGVLRPIATLDGFGRLGEPDATLGPVPAERLLAGEIGPLQPPGLYEDSVTGARRALNLAAATPELTSLEATDLGRAPEPFTTTSEVDLRAWFLIAALALLLSDLLASWRLRGFGAVARGAPAAMLIVAALTFAATPSRAQPFDPADLALSTPLAYVASGDPTIDRMAEAGLTGLAVTLWRRTSVEPSDPVAVDLASDPLDVFPILFWPVPETVRPLEEATAQRLLVYLENGGMVIFDTRDANLAVRGSNATTPGMGRLRTLLQDVELPALELVGGEHALTRSFYLLQDFPGRFTGPPIWVDRAQPGVNDGVSSIVIGANDWLGAWAVDETDRPLLPVVPGGERQRELARRVGVNLVMYALTGNYKTDQVHVPTLLERLGQ